MASRLDSAERHANEHAQALGRAAADQCGHAEHLAASWAQRLLKDQPAFPALVSDVEWLELTSNDPELRAWL